MTTVINTSKDADYWSLNLNKGFKTLLAIFIVGSSFLGHWSGVLVEGSPAITSEQETNHSTEQIIAPNDQAALFLEAEYIPNLTLNLVESRQIIVTGYSSTPDQTDDTPFITASGKWVSEGIAAANFLPFGTKIRLPKLFGDKIFIIEDRMHQKYADERIDIWFPDRKTAENFGIQETTLEILQ